MALQFMIRGNKKKEARVVVLRIVMKEGKLGKAIGGFDTLGTLKAFDAEYLKQFAQEKSLSDDEIYELENYVSYLLFNKKEFNSTFTTIKREFVFFDNLYYENLYKLWKLAKVNNIPFCPAEVMQSALLNKAKAVERKLNQLLKEPVNILESMGVSLKKLGDSSYREQVSKDCVKLFKLLLTIPKSLEELCAEFQKIALVNYRKSDDIKPYYFKTYAKDLKRLPMWYNTVAIDVLLANNKNPLDALSVDAVADNWIRLRKDTLNIEEAYRQFRQIFNPKPEDDEAFKAAIVAQYQQGISTANE